MYEGDLKADLLAANDGNVFFAACDLATVLASFDPSDPFRQPYSPANAALRAADFFDIPDSKDLIERAIFLVTPITIPEAEQDPTLDDLDLSDLDIDIGGEG